MTPRTPRYRVHCGYGRTSKGQTKDRWRTFDTLGAARKEASRIYQRTGIVVSIEQA